MDVILAKTVASLLLPPGILVVLLVAALLLRRRRRSLATSLVVTALALLVVLSQPMVAGFLLRSLERHVALDPATVKQSGAAIVMLGGGYYPNAPEYDGEDTVSGSVLERMRYAVWLQRRSGLPLLVSGGSVVAGDGEPEAVVVARVLREDFGVAPRWVESHSRNTRENARYSREILRAAGIDHVYLVTHAWHMTRAVESFERAGFRVSPAPTMFTTRGDAGLTMLDLAPSAAALYVSHTALHELLGRLWYALRQ